MIRESMRLRRAATVQAAMLPAEVVLSEQQAHCGAVVIPSLAKAVGQSAHALAEMADRAIHAFGMAGADLGIFRLTQNDGLLIADYSGRRILPPILFNWFLKYLDDRSVINSAAQEPANPVGIRNPAVCGQVKAARSCISELLAELGGVHVGSSAKVPRNQQLASTLNGSETVGIPHAASNLFAEGSGLLAVNELPNFVCLNVYNADAFNCLGHPCFALGSDCVAKVDNGAILDAGNAGNTANWHTLANQRENFDGHIHAQPHTVEGLREGRPTLAAYLAAETSRAAFVGAVLNVVRVVAGGDNHCGVAFISGSRYNLDIWSRLGESLVVIRPDETRQGFTGVFIHVFVVLQIIVHCKQKIDLQEIFFVVQFWYGKTTRTRKAAGSGGRPTIRNHSVQIGPQRAQGLRSSSRARGPQVLCMDTPQHTEGGKEPIQAGLAERGGIEPYRRLPNPTAEYKSAAPTKTRTALRIKRIRNLFVQFGT